jgi:DNA-binding response OmpR family regulator
MCDETLERTEDLHPVVVYELGRRWVDSLGNGALGPEMLLRHTASVPATLEALRAEPFSTLIVELGPAPLEAIELLAQIERLPNRVVPIAVARSDQSDFGIAARELGAVMVLYEPITGAELARAVRCIIQLQRARIHENECNGSGTD